MPSRVLAVINYRSAALAAQAVSSARRASNTPLNVVLIDNSCDPMERSALDASGADLVITAPSNIGYAGGINLALSRSSGQEIIVSNPDIEFFESSIDRLFLNLERSFELAGPKFVWDREGKWILPPAHVAGRRSLVDEVLSSRSAMWERMSNARRLRSRVAFWTAEQPTRVRAISGAVMAFRRSLVEKVGGFDERFRLYFEEIDFQRRMDAQGAAIGYVPDAVCRHLYNQSAASTRVAAQLFDESESAYHQKWGSGLIHRASRIWRGPGRRETFEDREPGTAIPLPEAPAGFLAEASPLADFRSAAGSFPAPPGFVFPSDVWGSYKGSELFLRLVNLENLEPVAHYRFSKGH